MLRIRSMGRGTDRYEYPKELEAKLKVNYKKKIEGTACNFKLPSIEKVLGQFSQRYN